jgi:tetratricopeptide (TPR) repeat protein
MKNSLFRIIFATLIISFFVFQANVIHSEVSNGEKIKKANELYLSGKWFIEQGNYQAANESFKKAQSLLEKAPASVPKQSQAVLQLSRQALSPKEEAKKVTAKNATRGLGLQQIYRANNKKADYYYNKAVDFIEDEKYQEAAGALKKTIEFAPQGPDAYYNLGVLYEDYLDDKWEARKYYRKYIRLAPDAKDSLQVEGWIKRINAELGGQ